MQSLVLLILMTIAWFGGVAQPDTTGAALKTRYVIWYTPVLKNTKINGLAVGLYAAPWRDTGHLDINGVCIDANPLGLVFGFFYPLLGTIASAAIHQSDTAIPQQDFIRFRNNYPDSLAPVTEIKGIDISAGTFAATIVKGLSVNATSSYANFVGLSVCSIMNAQYFFQGISIAGLRNKAAKANGLQIGLINAAKSGRVVQIGLINRIGKRTLPFINLKLGKHYHS